MEQAAVAVSAETEAKLQLEYFGYKLSGSSGGRYGGGGKGDITTKHSGSSGGRAITGDDWSYLDGNDVDNAADDTGVEVVIVEDDRHR